MTGSNKFNKFSHHHRRGADDLWRRHLRSSPPTPLIALTPSWPSWTPLAPLLLILLISGAVVLTSDGHRCGQCRNAYVVGGTDSLDFPTDASTGNFQGGSCSTEGVFSQPFTFNCPNAFLTEIDPTGATRLFSTYLGGASGDVAFSVAVDGSGSTYLAGSTLSSNFPTAPTGSVLKSSMSGYANAFIAKFGSAGPPGVMLSASTLPLGSQNVGTTSAAQTETVTNNGGANLVISTVTISGTNAGDFAISADTCTGATVIPTNTCTVSVTFTPTATGSRSASLMIPDNATGSPQTVALTGTGQDFTVAPPTGSSSSATVAPGSPATYTLSVGAEGGLSGNVSFACTGAPFEAICSVSPNPAAAGTNVTVKVTTTAPSGAVPRSRPLPPIPPTPAGRQGLVLFALVLAAMAWGIRRRRQTGGGRWPSVVLPLAAGLLLALAVAGCGVQSGGGGTTSDPGTPAGTYTLTVTGTAGSGASAVSHDVKLTLVVS